MTQEPTSSADQIHRRFAAQLPRNLAANIAHFLVNVAIGILLVPYFVSTLGVAAYGLIPLAASITGYIGIVIHSLNTAVSRFLTVDLQRGDYGAANQTFNTALFGFTLLILLMIPVIFVVAYFIPSIFNVPAGQESGTVLLFLGVSAAFLLRSWSGNFTVQLFAYNRLDLQNLVNITSVVIQTGLIVLFFTLLGPDLALVGGAYLTGAVVASGISIVFAKRVCPHLQVSIRSFDHRKIKDLCGMGWWVVVSQVGALLFLNIELIVVNMLFGGTSAGEYAIALQWAILLRSIAGVLSGVLTPVIFTQYARGQSEAIIQVSKSAVKLMGLAMALPIGLICGFAPHLLMLWVGEEYITLAPLMILLTVHLTVNLAVLPLFPVRTAYNRVKIPGVVLLVMGIANLLLAIQLPIITGWGVYGVAMASAIILTLTNALFTPWYVSHILNIPWYTFMRPMILGVFATIGVIVVALITTACVEISEIPLLFGLGLVISGGYLVVLWLFAFNRFEHDLFCSYLPRGLREKVQ